MLYPELNHIPMRLLKIGVISNNEQLTEILIIMVNIDFY